MIVMKFGGTSVKDGDAMDRACRIVADRMDRKPIVVVSALAGVTSGLLEAARLARDGEAEGWTAAFARIREQHLRLLEDLEPELNRLRKALEKVAHQRSLPPDLEDLIAAHGEILSSRIFQARLARLVESVHVDSRRCLITDDRFTRARPLMDETQARVDEVLKPLVEGRAVPVMGGYIASTKAGDTSTLGRGGSDYSASIFGACLDAEEIEIWTDVNGMMTADPRVVPEAWTIRNISFAEAAELAYFGAKVLHPATVLPAVQKGIPVRILNSARPDRSGTAITAEAPSGRSLVKSFACKRGITAITVTSSRMLMAHGFLRALFEVFDRHRTSVDMVTTSEVSVSLTTDDDSALDTIVSDLKMLGDVQVERGMALVCMVGSNLKGRPGIASQAFSSLSDVNVRMISLGASKINLSFVVEESLADTVLRRLHEQFFKEFEPEIFDRG